MPFIKFNAAVTDQSQTKSQEDILRTFSVLADIAEHLGRARRLGAFSHILGVLHDLPEVKAEGKSLQHARRFPSHGEADVQQLVRILMKDVIKGIGYLDRVEIKTRTTMLNVRSASVGHATSNFLTVTTSAGRPIMIIVVKSPRIPNILASSTVRKQVLDYMLELMYTYGQYHVIDAVTTMDKFQFHWFPHTDAYMAAKDVPDESSVLSGPLDLPRYTNADLICSSAVIHHTDPALVEMLATAIIKCYNSPYAPVPALHENRGYLRVTVESWEWTRLQPADIQNSTFHMTEGALQAKDFGVVVLKNFLRTVGKKVWLAISEKTRQVVVVKLFDDEVHARRERDLWQVVNGFRFSFVAKLYHSYGMCAPMTIHASEIEVDSSAKRVFFNFDLHDWMTQAGAVPLGALPAQLAVFAADLERLGTDQDVRTVAQAAIAKAANARVVHKDLEWRHIALMPVFEGGHAGLEVLVRLEPVLLDFGLVDEDVETTEALAIMTARLGEMTQNCVF